MSNTSQLLQHSFFIFTSCNDRGSYCAVPVSWACQVSSEPMLVGVSLKTGSKVEQIVGESGSFALHTWLKSQVRIAEKFFGKTERVAGRMNGVTFCTGQTGSPIFEEAASYAEFQLDSSLRRGDHTFVIGELVREHISLELQQEGLTQLLRLADLPNDLAYT